MQRSELPMTGVGFLTGGGMHMAPCVIWPDGCVRIRTGGPVDYKFLGCIVRERGRGIECNISIAYFDILDLCQHDTVEHDAILGNVQLHLTATVRELPCQRYILGKCSSGRKQPQATTKQQQRFLHRITPDCVVWVLTEWHSSSFDITLQAGCISLTQASHASMGGDASVNAGSCGRNFRNWFRNDLFEAAGDRAFREADRLRTRQRDVDSSCASVGNEPRTVRDRTPGQESLDARPKPEAPRHGRWPSAAKNSPRWRSTP
jgi:hypothetical protein